MKLKTFQAFIVIFSAHGVPKSVPKEALNKKIFYIDATLHPLVHKSS